MNLVERCPGFHSVEFTVLHVNVDGSITETELVYNRLARIHNLVTSNTVDMFCAFVWFVGRDWQRPRLSTIHRQTFVLNDR